MISTQSRMETRFSAAPATQLRAAKKERVTPNAAMHKAPFDFPTDQVEVKPINAVAKSIPGTYGLTPSKPLPDIAKRAFGMSMKRKMWKVMAISMAMLMHEKEGMTALADVLAKFATAEVARLIPPIAFFFFKRLMCALYAALNLNQRPDSEQYQILRGRSRTKAAKRETQKIAARMKHRVISAFAMFLKVSTASSCMMSRMRSKTWYATSQSMIAMMLPTAAKMPLMMGSISTPLPRAKVREGDERK
mmetsp:Transcript_21928/g.43797  ORF Transcript_21928/g.43797 Transcript_21928/m.43797 type:complete len:248 (+) Transcript_21928:1507-2250(+)